MRFFSIMGLIVLGLLGCICSGQDVGKKKPVKTASICELMKTPSAFDGEEVSIRATYRVAYETSELYDTACSGDHGIWVKFADSEEGNRASHKIDRLIRTRGTVTGQFIGTFHKGTFGHMAAYDTELVVHSASDLKRIDRLGLAPRRSGDKLPQL